MSKQPRTFKVFLSSKVTEDPTIGKQGRIIHRTKTTLYLNWKNVIGSPVSKYRAYLNQ